MQVLLALGVVMGLLIVLLRTKQASGEPGQPLPPAASGAACQTANMPGDLQWPWELRMMMLYVVHTAA